MAGLRCHVPRIAQKCANQCLLCRSWYTIWMMYFSIWMLYLPGVQPFSFLCPVLVYRPGQAVCLVHRPTAHFFVPALLSSSDDWWRRRRTSPRSGVQQQREVAGDWEGHSISPYHVSNNNLHGFIGLPGLGNEVRIVKLVQILPRKVQFACLA